MAEYFKHAGDVLDGVADDEDQDNQKRNAGKSALSFTQAGLCGSSHVLKTLYLACLWYFLIHTEFKIKIKLFFLFLGTHGNILKQ